eukprot:TRINITY_DN1514_c0_g1_i2.p1 TRINITY_DN1514_c0_g1~~TRINITY_DN1514_c0_g1_i2.p1  ORF type:complete len:120 (+),score=30.95 TRINITY_DN1514_c0_g1_i2:526-885(+)
MQSLLRTRTYLPLLVLRPHNSLRVRFYSDISKIKRKPIERWTEDDLFHFLTKQNADKDMVDAFKTQHISGKEIYSLNPPTLHDLIEKSLQEDDEKVINKGDLEPALQETLLLSARYSMR